jgi:hypothetical protein
MKPLKALLVFLFISLAWVAGHVIQQTVQKYLPSINTSPELYLLVIFLLVMIFGKRVMKILGM